MTNLKTLLVTSAALSALTTAAFAGTYDSSANYNAPIGMASSSSMNAPVNTSLRDANGNLVVQNGQITSSSFSEVGGVQSFNGGVGGGIGGTSSAMAVGNQLNVITTGSNNIVIVDSTQTNTGNQTANSTVN